MTTEPNGPYPNVLYEQDYTIMQADYDRGFKAGRSSRDRLREALENIAANECCIGCSKRIADESLAADEKHGQ
jgi:hypothetical protein